MHMPRLQLIHFLVSLVTLEGFVVKDDRSAPFLRRMGREETATQFSEPVATRTLLRLATPRVDGPATVALPSVLANLPLRASVKGYRRIPLSTDINCSEDTTGDIPYQTHNVTIQRVAQSPHVFVLRNFLIAKECDALVGSAIHSNNNIMKPAQTALGASDETVKRRNSFVGWLPNTELNGLVGRLAHDARSLLFPNCTTTSCCRDTSMDQLQGVEDLQIVRYEPDGQYVLHHDGHQRILTVLYYLDNVGETWFPLAQVHEHDSAMSFAARQQALECAERYVPGRDGLLISASGSGSGSCLESRHGNTVSIEKGDAIAFYNYHVDGKMDWNALHAGLPATSTKWIANHWFHIGVPLDVRMDGAL